MSTNSTTTLYYYTDDTTKFKEMKNKEIIPLSNHRHGYRFVYLTDVSPYSFNQFDYLFGHREPHGAHFWTKHFHCVQIEMEGAMLKDAGSHIWTVSEEVNLGRLKHKFLEKKHHYEDNADGNPEKMSARRDDSYTEYEVKDA